MPKIFPIIRIARHGCTNRHFLHVVLMNNNDRRDAAPIEQLGTLDPMPNAFNEKLVSLDVERINFHLANGVALSQQMEKLLGLAGLLPVHPMSYINAKRNRKKQAAAQTENNQNKSSHPDTNK